LKWQIIAAYRNVVYCTGMNLQDKIMQLLLLNLPTIITI